MNRIIFEYFSFTKDEQPNWSCPSCEKGRLRLLSDSLNKTEDSYTRKWKHDEEFDGRDASFCFTARFQCDEKACREVVHLVGKASWEQDGVEYDDNGYPFPRDVLSYRPCFASPAFSVFTIPPDTPETVSKALKAGFNLILADANAAANQLRTSVECLLDELKVPKRAKSKPRNAPKPCVKCGTVPAAGPPPSLKAKFADLSLHQRIEKLPSRHKSLRDDLIAVKWLGNAGSHASGISREHMLTGYEIMERCLLKLYDPTHTALDQKIKSINSKRGKMGTRNRR